MVKIFTAVLFLSAFGTTTLRATAEPIDTSFVKAYKHHSDAWIAVSIHREQGISQEDSDLIVQAYYDHFLGRLFLDNLEDVVVAFHSAVRRQQAIVDFMSQTRVPFSTLQLARFFRYVPLEASQVNLVQKYLSTAPRIVYRSEILELAEMMQSLESKKAVLDHWVTTTYSRYFRNVYDSDLEELNKALGVEHFKVGARSLVRSSHHRSGTYEVINNVWTAVRSCNELVRGTGESAFRL